MDPSLVTLGLFTAEYNRHREALNLSLETKRRDTHTLRSLTEALGESCQLRHINQRKIDQWAGSLLANGVKPITINSYLRHIRSALNTAVEWDCLAKTPRLKPLKEPKRLPRALTPQEAARLLFKEKNFERRALWRFLIWTGLRRQELIDLAWPAVHLQDDEPFITVIGKGDKQRVVPLLPGAVAALAAMPRYDLGPVWRFHFRCYRKPKPVTGSPISRWFKEAALRAGIPDAHLHDLRHTAATWMAARGVPEHVIQDVLGHANITTTQVYTKGLGRVANLYRALKTGLD